MCLSHEVLTAAYQGFLDQLTDAGLLIPSGVPGVYGHSGVFERVLEGFDQSITRRSAHLNAEVIRFPGVLNRQHYPTATGTLREGGRTVDLRSFVFRHEPSIDPCRMQMFRMHEAVRLGSPEQALAHRGLWMELGKEILNAAGLNVECVVANDPFFGRGGRVMAVSQKEQSLKFEMVIPVATAEKPTAIMSCNYHLDYFGKAFGIHTADGQVAHSACMGFGLERVTLALFKTHGFHPDRWPADVKHELGL